ncbi:PIH1 domain containing 1 [Megalopta genalis]|uniref:PIH1 domain containing 1 n=1 Tax=Megalopta genalis TaxID=115081 RepID=UPI00144332C6|nr:PIH1 domain-containing protein 1-like [Megalopta genalis]
MNNRTFLDVDDSIITKNLILPETAAQDNLLKQIDTKPYFIIQPTPGICIKTKTDGGEKVFLNICTSDKIPAPEDISDTQLFEIISKENPEFVIPMSIGNEKFESDKGGSPCITYDVAINVTYFEKCQQRKHFLLFTISVIMDGVGMKMNRVLNSEDYVILKNRKVMGKLQQHKIENRETRIQSQAKRPLIEEIMSSKTETSAKKINETRDSPMLKYTLLKQPIEGPATNLIGLFEMPKGINGEDVEVLLDEDRIVITVDKTGLTHDLSVSYNINVASVKCRLDKDLKVLRLDMPVQSAANSIK